jgi:hypothetical protein
MSLCYGIQMSYYVATLLLGLASLFTQFKNGSFLIIFPHLIANPTMYHETVVMNCFFLKLLVNYYFVIFNTP